MTAIDDRMTGIFDLSEPTRASISGLPDCTVQRTGEFGDPVPVGLLGVTLDTSEFRAYS
ncbi:hypothetical protein [Kitasatospora sp. NPDC017646]|uniref:hypothetical protein n=1 Tax=Kitasatospora sp. NPDC017646 TaxID=3364024 RepID=UPI0037B8C37D